MDIHDSFMRRCLTVTVAVAAVIVSVHVATGQVTGMPDLDATEPLGETPAQGAESSAESGKTVSPPPFTRAQVQKGRHAYMDNCATCHGDRLDNGEFGGAPLKGSYFDNHWGGAPVAALYGYLSSAMPPDRPGSLNAQTYTDITAFLLSRNGFHSTGEELPSDSEAQSRIMLNRD